MKYFIPTFIAILGYLFTFNPLTANAYSYYESYYYPEDYYYDYYNYSYDSYYDQYSYYPQHNYNDGGCMFSGGIAAAIACRSSYSYSSNYSSPIYYQPANTNYGYGYSPQYNWPQGHPIHHTGGIAGSLAAGF